VKHELLLSQVQLLLWNYGGPFGKCSETTSIKKYCRFQVAILNDGSLNDTQKKSVMQVHKMEYPPLSKFILSRCASQAKSPTITIQFCQSIWKSPSNWKDKGHEDCLEELVLLQLSSITTAGLKWANLATGTTYMKNDPNLISLECDISQEKQVTCEILLMFSTTMRKEKIKDCKLLPWIAIPYFKGQDMKGDKRFIPQYTEIKATEKIYQEDICLRHTSDITCLDEVAPESAFLSPSMLKQLEQTIWDHGETLI